MLCFVFILLQALFGRATFDGHDKKEKEYSNELMIHLATILFYVGGILAEHQNGDYDVLPHILAGVIQPLELPLKEHLFFGAKPHDDYNSKSFMNIKTEDVQSEYLVSLMNLNRAEGFAVIFRLFDGAEVANARIHNAIARTMMEITRRNKIFVADNAPTVNELSLKFRTLLSFYLRNVALVSKNELSTSKVDTPDKPETSTFSNDVILYLRVIFTYTLTNINMFILIYT